MYIYIYIYIYIYVVRIRLLVSRQLNVMPMKVLINELNRLVIKTVCSQHHNENGKTRFLNALRKKFKNSL